MGYSRIATQCGPDRETEPGEFLELTGDGLRALVARDAELSDILMRAFILRRLQLISQGQGNVILLGYTGAPSASGFLQGCLSKMPRIDPSMHTSFSA